MSDELVSTRDKRIGWRRLSIVVPIAMLSLAPLIWSALLALRPGDEIFRNLSPISWATFFPTEWTLDNFLTLLDSSFSKAILNTVIVTGIAVIIGLMMASLAAFPLAVIAFPGRTAVFIVIVVSFLIPFEAVAIPLAGIFRDLGLQNTYLGLILPGIGNGLAVFLLRQFFANIPPSLAEAARMDGASWLRIYWQIYLPLSRPAMIGAGLILFVFQWQSFLWPLLIAPDPEMKVIPVAIADFAGDVSVDYGAMFAGAILAVIIPLALLLAFQRQFTASLASSGSKE